MYSALTCSLQSLERKQTLSSRPRSLPEAVERPRWTGSQRRRIVHWMMNLRHARPYFVHSLRVRKEVKRSREVERDGGTSSSETRRTWHFKNVQRRNFCYLTSLLHDIYYTLLRSYNMAICDLPNARVRSNSSMMFPALDVRQSNACWTTSRREE